MFHRSVFHPLIESDLREVIVYYESRSPGLGHRFRDRFYLVMDELLLMPEAQARKLGNIRTRLVRPFPYLVFYAFEADTIWILSVQYAGRKPAYLRGLVRRRQNPDV